MYMYSTLSTSYRDRDRETVTPFAFITIYIACYSMTLQEIMDVLLPLAENHTEPLHMNVTGTEYTRHNQIRFNLSLYAREPHIPDGTHKLHIIGGTINGDQNESSTWLYPGEIVTISAHAPAPGEEFVMWNPHDNDNRALAK